MKHKSISCVSVLLAILICCSTVTFSATSINESTATASKISPELQAKVAEMSDSDTIEVAVWLNNTDEYTLENAYKTELQNSINRGIITADANTATAIFDESSSTDIEALSLEKTQQLLSIRRSSFSDVIVDNNIEWQNDVKSILSNDTDTIYSSTYAPVVIMQTTKLDLDKLASSNKVESIYYYTNKESPVDNDLSVEETFSTTSNYGAWQNVSNIYTLRTVMGYTGAGIKIGMLENNLPDENSTSLASQKSKIIPTNTDGTDGHATYVASIIVGKTDDYTGVAPNATLYCGGNNVGYIDSIDNLVSSGINILTISLALGYSSNIFNTYGFYSKFLDYISYNYGVAVCMCAGNYGAASEQEKTGVPEGAMGYNLITVGNVALSGTYPNVDIVLAGDSSYLLDNTEAYKPDLCAPGKGVVTPDGSGGGTSAATPVVAGICALLMEADSRLIGRPSLVKSILMSSVDRISSMGEIYSTTSSTPALSRGYGAGMVDAMSAYNLLNSSNWRCIEIPSALTSEEPYTMNFTVSQNDINSGKKIAVCITWVQKVISDDSGNSDVYDVPLYSLSIRNSSNSRVAYSYYRYDRKQFIYFKPTVAGTYTISANKEQLASNTAVFSMSYYESN